MVTIVDNTVLYISTNIQYTFGPHQKSSLLFKWCILFCKDYTSVTLIFQVKKNLGWWGCREKETPMHSWWECKLVQPVWKAYGSFSKNEKIELPYDPIIPFLGLYPKEIKTGYQRDTCTPMFIAASFTIIKIWRQPKCLSVDEWIKSNIIFYHIYIYNILSYIYKMTEYYSALTKKEILPFATIWIELEGIYIK